MTHKLTYNNGHTSITKGNISLVEAQGYFTGNEYTIGSETLVCVKVEKVK